ncbi:epididymal-specific lipocalin-6 [Ctenodactylus gundi]
MGAVLLATLPAVVSAPRAQAVWLGRMDPQQLLRPWYILAVASRERGFVVGKDTRATEGVAVRRVQLARGGAQKQESGWVFENPVTLGVLEYRVLGTDFKD